MWYNRAKNKISHIFGGAFAAETVLRAEPFDLIRIMPS